MAAPVAQSWTTQEAPLVAPRRRDDVMAEELDSEAVLFDQKNSSTFRLNKTAWAVWQQCNGRTTTRQIAQQLTEAYEVELDKALDDVEDVVAMLATTQLLIVDS